MDKESVGKDYNDTPTDDALGVKPCANVGDHKDSNKRKFHEDRKRAKYDGESSGLGDKERNKIKKRNKSELELDWTDKEELTKHDSKASGSGYGKEKRKDRKNKKDKYDAEGVHVEEVSNDTHTVGLEKARKDNRIIGDTEVVCEEKKKRKHKKSGDDLGVGLQESEADKPVNASCGTESDNCVKAKSHKNADRKRQVNDDDDTGDSNKGKNKKGKSVNKVSDGKVEQVLRTNMAKNSSEKKSLKRISFSDQVEVFPSADSPSDAYEDNPSDVETTEKDGLVRGKRFTPEEDEMIKQAVSNYIELHNLGEQGIDKIMHCKVHREVKDCWKEIAAALPWRPYGSVYHRGHILFERDDSCKWTADEYELVRKFHEKHGSDWRTIADALGKHRYHVKHAWERIKLPNMKRGQWTQDEYQNLFALVNADLRVKAFEEKKSQHGMLRDNICWSVISTKLSTRTNALCCKKWYAKLTSSMVVEGKWADTDDYRLIDALVKLDACCIEDVDWDGLLEHRPGDVCRKRWNQMVNHLGHLGTKSFAEQVEVLSQRYPVDVLEAKEAYDSQPAADS